jgi:N utilization substance protein A
MNAAFIEALEELGNSKGISKEDILLALKEALEKGFKKEIGEGDDVNVRVTIDPETGEIYMAQIKTVVEDDKIQDDALEISLAEAKKIVSDAKVGDEIAIAKPIDEVRKATAMSVKSLLRQKLSEFEKIRLYEKYKDKVGEMIIGEVEKSDERGVTVSLDNVSVYLSRKELIGNETFKAGRPIKLYVADVSKDAKGPRILVSRSDAGFLKRVFEEEIHEIYDGTIIIKSIARESGERSKVAVYSNDPNVDAVGACIGPNGSRIQKIVAQLGNGPQKEKIDVIMYSDNKPMFIVESLKPAKIIGIKMDEENKKATAIVDNDSLSLAIGKKGVNARLACRLTGFSIDIKELDDAKALGIEYTPIEELERIEIEHKQKLAQEAFAAASKKIASAFVPAASSEPKEEEIAPAVRSAVPEGYVAPSDRIYQDEAMSDEEREALEEELDEEEAISAVEAHDGDLAEQVEKVKTPVAEELSGAEKVVEEPVKVKTTTTLEDLEKELEKEAKKSKTTQGGFRRPKKKEQEEEKDELNIPVVDPAERMSIYTEEELKELESEETIDEDIIDSGSDDVDYDEYETYYDDDDK